MQGRALQPAAVAVLVVCAAALAVDAWSAYFGCASMQVESSAPGGPAAEPQCVREFSPILLLLLVPPIFVALGVVLRRTWMAWSGAAIHAMGVPFYFLSTQWLRLAAAVALLGAVAAWSSRTHAKAGAPARPALPGTKTAVVVSAALLAGVALFAVVPQIPDFWDPCLSWGAPSSGTMTASPDGPCSSGGSSSETRGERAAILAFIFGVPIMLSAAVAWAARRQQGLTLVAAGVLLAVQAVPLYFLALPAFVLTWPIAALWIGSGVEWRRHARQGLPQMPNGSRT